MFKVIIIDDEPWALEGLCRIIDWNEYGFLIVDAVSSSVAGLELIIQKQPDLVFIDIRMPELSGLDIIKKVRELDFSTEFVFVSGFGDFSYAQSGMHYGVFDYLLKPVKKNDLIVVLGRLYDLLCKKEETEIKLLLADDYRKFDLNTTLREVDKTFKSVVAVNKNVNTELPGIRIGENKYILFLRENQVYDFSLEEGMFIGVSEEEGNIIAMHEQADIAMGSGFIHKKGGEYKYRKTEVSEINLLIEKIFSDIKNKNEEEIKTVFADVVTEFEEKSYLLNDAVYFWNQIVAQISKEKYEQIEDFEMNFMTYMQISEHFSDFSEMCDYIACVFSIINHSSNVYIDHATFKNILEYINENYDKKLYLRNIAGKYYLNAAYCCQLFKKILKKTFSEYLLEIRMDEAKKLLANPEMSIGEIALKIGYDDYHYFSKVFKKYYSVSPQQYRKQKGGSI